MPPNTRAHLLGKMLCGWDAKITAKPNVERVMESVMERVMRAMYCACSVCLWGTIPCASSPRAEQGFPRLPTPSG